MSVLGCGDRVRGYCELKPPRNARTMKRAGRPLQAEIKVTATYILSEKRNESVEHLWNVICGVIPATKVSHKQENVDNIAPGSHIHVSN